MGSENQTQRLWSACWNQWFAEQSLLRRGVRFRSDSPTEVLSSYEAMTIEEFDSVNGRQAWANGRILPSILAGRLPSRSLNVIDLGCGTGASTQALAACCPSGTRLLAIEQSAQLLEAAVQRQYTLRDGAKSAVAFSRQSIAETWRGRDGRQVSDKSVDLVVSCGVIGHHFNMQTAIPVFEEIRRVLCPGAFACIDAGPTLSKDVLSQSMASRGLRTIDERKSCLLDRNCQLLFQQSSEFI